MKHHAMVRTRHLAVFLAVLLCLPVAQPGAAGFGRFFTTPEQRQRLDTLRHTDPELKVEIREQDLNAELEERQPAERQTLNSLTVKGLVRRKDGASTAWINDSNTYEGDITSDYLQLDRNDIRDDAVRLEMPGARGVEVKVGETYDPGTDQLIDIGTKQPASAGSP